MKVELTRIEKLHMLVEEMDRLQEKVRRREPLDPRPPPPPPVPNHEAIIARIDKEAEPLIELNRHCSAHGGNGREARWRRIIELMTANLKADGSDIGAMLNRAVAYKGLQM
ncbi:hypothetical protein EXIGLDRAFT_161074 [Exidia glandulosa HHB12029]|uniref:Uncharacterized protein n=1 Tax=Exidia glandulosa HHB12029 TaxID=1314781 RepID=A0A165FHL7_EXIGL|nr:hypothetical protein EXIGLDRAFT_161074 [Exidia glandulosa HHB12029]